MICQRPAILPGPSKHLRRGSPKGGGDPGSDPLRSGFPPRKTSNHPAREVLQKWALGHLLIKMLLSEGFFWFPLSCIDCLLLESTQARVEVWVLALLGTYPGFECLSSSSCELSDRQRSVTSMVPRLLGGGRRVSQHLFFPLPRPEFNVFRSIEARLYVRRCRGVKTAAIRIGGLIRMLLQQPSHLTQPACF